MGIHTERLRELLKNIPKSPAGFTPELASMCITQLANGSLQVIGHLEDINADLEKENDRLVEMLVAAGAAPEWIPTKAE